MADGSDTKITVKADKAGRPLIHVLGYAGTTADNVAVLKSIKVAIPDAPADQAEAAVYCLLVNGNGEPYVDADGDYVVLPAPPMQLGGVAQPDAMLSRADIVERSGLSLSTVKRAEKDGSLGPSVQISARRVAYPAAQVNEWFEKHRAGSVRKG